MEMNSDIILSSNGRKTSTTRKTEKRKKSKLQDTFIRAGIAKHSNLGRVMERLREYDDVILGIDTNVLLDCVVTSVLIEKLFAEDFPNWILFVIPKITMAELENKANQQISDPSINQGWVGLSPREGLVKGHAGDTGTR